MTVNDPLTEDLRALLGPDYDELPSDEQWRLAKNAVEYDAYAPGDAPDAAESNLYNPAVEGYREAGLSWSESGWEPVDSTAVLRRFPEYVPTDRAIEVLIDAGPLVEVGSGDGYWAHVVNENGGDCLPTDIRPEDVDATEYPTTFSFEGHDEEYAVWADVREFDAVDAIAAHPGRAVVMCHPDGATRWGEDVLDAIDDQRFIFIGEWFPGPDATPMFFKSLATDWELVETFPVYDWASMHAHGYVFEKA